MVPTVWLPVVPACFFSLALQSSCWFYEILDTLPINSFPVKISQSVSIACDQELYHYTTFLKVIYAYLISSCWMTSGYHFFIPWPRMFSVGPALILFNIRQKNIYFMQCWWTFSRIHKFYKTADTNEKFAVQQEGRGLWHNHMQAGEANTGLKSLNPS